MAAGVTNRRGFLTGLAVRSETGPFPPGATSQSVVNCTGCGDCVSACPTGIISIRSGVPIVDFRRGECTFCGRCSEQCPERVFPPEPARSFDHLAVIGDDCLAVNYVDCQSCRDVCPERAIRFRPRLGGPFVPTLDADACTGCGACVSVCPSRSVSISAFDRENINA